MRKVPMNRSHPLRKLGVVLALVFVWASYAAAQAAPSATDDVEQRVNAIVSRMTLEEKVDMLGGINDMFIRALPRLGLPSFKMADGPLGVRNYGPATAMAGGIGLAASWDPALASRVGKEIGRDARAKGVHFMLGPGVNIYRAPMNGRNFEYFGEDPYLASQIAVGYIEGMQSVGVSATVKHFLGNNSEFDRHNTDTIMDERTMREIYLPAFEAAVKQAHVGAVMDSYNLLNGSHLSQNKHANIDILKDEWGFNGILMSDWTSTYDAVAAANGGLDLEMPSGLFFNREKLLPAIQQGLVTEATIDDKIRRILRTAIQFGWLDRDQTDLSISRYNREGDQVAFDAALEGAVLLKNENNALPLKKEGVKSVLVVGPGAYPPVPVGGGSARVLPFQAVSFVQGFSDYFGGAAQVYYSPGVPSLSEMADATFFATEVAGGAPGLKAEYFASSDLQGQAIISRNDPHVDFGSPARAILPDQPLSSRWTGYFTAPEPGNYDLFVSSSGEDGGYYRVHVDGKLVLDDWTDSKELLGSRTAVLRRQSPQGDSGTSRPVDVDWRSSAHGNCATGGICHCQTPRLWRQRPMSSSSQPALTPNLRAKVRIARFDCRPGRMNSFSKCSRRIRTLCRAYFRRWRRHERVDRSHARSVAGVVSRDKKEEKPPQKFFLATRILRAISRQHLSDAGKTIQFTTATILQLAPIALYTKRACSSVIVATSTMAQSRSFPSAMAFRTPRSVTATFA